MRAIIALMMETARTSETSVYFYQITRRYNPEDSHLHTSGTSVNFYLTTRLSIPEGCHLHNCRRENL
jgi:hypothetical protein